MNTTTKRYVRNHEQFALSGLALGVVVTDQVTKAIARDGAFIVNTGGAFVLPPRAGNLLWANQTIGALVDTAGAALLLAAARRIPKLTAPGARLASVLFVAGLASNLLDRLGVASLVHPGIPRGAIDWIPLGGAHVVNLADGFIVLGAAVLLAQAVRRGALTVARQVRGRRRLRSAGLIALAVWALWWGANRYHATAAHCHATTAVPCSWQYLRT